MPITRISVQNFKGIGQKTEITLKPITLFFGANSAGKSTLLQALLYLREVLERGNADADVVEGGGGAIDLGGFRQLVHQHTLANTLLVGITIALDDDGLPMSQHKEEQNAGTKILHQGIDAIKEIGVEVNVEWSEDINKVVITKYRVSADGSPILRIGQERLDRPKLWLNEMHPAIRLVLVGEDEYPLYDFEDPKLPPNMILDQVTVIPDWHQPLIGTIPGEDDDQEPLDIPKIQGVAERLALGAGRLVIDVLDQIRYIGPLREYPQRKSKAQRTPSTDRWATGLAAWDWLGSQTSGLAHKKQVEEIGEWMSNSRHLDLGYTIRHKSWLELDLDSDLYVELLMAESGDEIEAAERLRRSFIPQFLGQPMMHHFLMSDLRNGAEVDPQDVGNGVTQLIPVLVGLMAEGGNILAVEQPELDLHPAVQCRLGDILIRALHDGRERLMLLETHSEHLMLRLMKRMRETSSENLGDPDLALHREDVQVIYVESFEGRTVLREMPLNSRGEWVKSWPGGFFDEDINEIF
jgi:hypothetical protein